MRTLLLFIVAMLMALPASAAVPQLSFESGGQILYNPSDDDFVLRSAQLDRVRLTLHHVANPELLNQITAARVTQSITEEGLRERVLAEAPAVWRATFVLGGNDAASPIVVPLSVAAGKLAPGVYMLAASYAGTGPAVPTISQWFQITDLAVHATTVEPGTLIMTTHRNAAVPVAAAHLWLLDNKGKLLPETPSDWRTDASGAVFWEGALPAGAALLRADDSNGNTALLQLTPPIKATAMKPKGKGIVITPQFDGNSVPAGTTAGFSVALRADDDRLLEETLRYEFARMTHSYRWLKSKDNTWEYQTTAKPTVIERGTLRPNRGQGAGQPVKLLLSATEGRFRLTVSTPDGALRQQVEFMAGWWRTLAAPQEELGLSAKLLAPQQLEITAPDRAETDAPRWAVLWRPNGPQTRTANGPLVDLPQNRILTQPIVAGLCVPGRDAGPVVCGVTLLKP